MLLVLLGLELLVLLGLYADYQDVRVIARLFYKAVKVTPSQPAARFEK